RGLVGSVLCIRDSEYISDDALILSTGIVPSGDNDTLDSYAESLKSEITQILKDKGIIDDNTSDTEVEKAISDYLSEREYSSSGTTTASRETLGIPAGASAKIGFRRKNDDKHIKIKELELEVVTDDEENPQLYTSDSGSVFAHGEVADENTLDLLDKMEPGDTLPLPVTMTFYKTVAVSEDGVDYEREVVYVGETTVDYNVTVDEDDNYSITFDNVYSLGKINWTYVGDESGEEAAEPTAPEEGGEQSDEDDYILSDWSAASV
ncbi:MAG: hypothetical protein LUC41_03590, partial [Clostridiales bacterium]|nr:hypothetical protein [Clostridiales bacterium]